ncbi:hypothetical protein DFJ74DRAFT_712713 [Hyaloraphidium curvatum]|nr:hypothetical protein DFJ74DRAFT_712713 [Hyaloraphidium curvatum]
MADVLALFHFPLLNELLSSGAYTVVLAGTATKPPDYRNHSHMAYRLFAKDGLEAMIWLLERNGKDFLGIYRCGSLLSGHRADIIHGSATALMFDEVLGSAATMTAHLVSGNRSLAYLTRNLTTSFFRPALVPNDFVVHARITNPVRTEDVPGAKTITIEGALYPLSDFVSWRKALSDGADVPEPKPLARGSADFSRVDLGERIARAAKL